MREGYRPLRHPVSSLALGPRGWVQAANFTVAGTLFQAGAAGLAGAGDSVGGQPAPALIGAAGAGLIAAAVFTTDPVSGYPPGTPDALTRPSRAAARTTLRPSRCSWVFPLPHSLAAGGAGEPASAASAFIAAAAASPCSPAWSWPGPASANHPGSSAEPGCSSVSASSPALAGSPPCPRERSDARLRRSGPVARHNRAEPFSRHPRYGRSTVTRRVSTATVAAVRGSALLESRRCRRPGRPLVTAACCSTTSPPPSPPSKRRRHDPAPAARRLAQQGPESSRPAMVRESSGEDPA